MAKPKPPEIRGRPLARMIGILENRSSPEEAVAAIIQLFACSTFPVRADRVAAAKALINLSQRRRRNARKFMESLTVLKHLKDPEAVRKAMDELGLHPEDNPELAKKILG